MNRSAEATAPPPPPPPSAPTQSVIHDIGYRHYDGARLGRGYIRRALFVESARGAYGLGRTGKSKVMPMLLAVVMCLPAVVIVVGTIFTGSEELVAGYATYVINMQIVIAIYVAGQAPASVSRDLRYGTMSLYFSRPMERGDYVVAKFAAMTTAIFVLIATPLTILLAGALVAKLPLGEQIPDYLRSMAGALLIAVLLAGISLVIAAMTPRRGLGVAAVISVLLVLAAVQGISQELAFDAGAATTAGYLALLSPFTLVDGIQTALLGAESAMYVAPTDIGAGLVFVAALVVLTVATFAALLLRYRKVSVS
ncbi:MAG TPA: ABC transporter permease subunit [Egicoccus sp.]|nr:ABC transporter permease subunit [Egicoccus sp.]HSK21545.1 ABC transporter permease subunit [Egicoccus sp.]